MPVTEPWEPPRPEARRSVNLPCTTWMFRDWRRGGGAEEPACGGRPAAEVLAAALPRRGATSPAEPDALALRSATDGGGAGAAPEALLRLGEDPVSPVPASIVWYVHDDDAEEHCDGSTVLFYVVDILTDPDGQCL